jgi:O-antigen ligase
MTTLAMSGRVPARPVNAVGTSFGVLTSDAAVIVPATLIVGGIVIGMALGLGPITMAATVASLLTALVAPTVGVAILAFMATLIGPPLPAPGYHLALVVAILLGCIYRLPLDRPQIRFTPPILLMLAIAAFVTVQQAPAMLAGYGTGADHAVGYLYLQLLTGLGAILAAAWVLRDGSPFAILSMAVAGVTVSALIAVVPYMAPALAGLFIHLSSPTDDPVRASGTFGNPNFMGGSAAISFAATMTLLFGARSRRVRAVLAVAALVLASAVVISLSRGAVIAALVGVMSLGIARGRRTAIAVVTGSAVAALVVFPAFVDWRLVNVIGSASAAAAEATALSDSGRLAGILAGVALFATSPIVGVGFGHYLDASARIPGALSVHGAHNWYTYLLGEQGIVGAALWALLVAIVVLRVRRLPVRPRSLGVSVLATAAAACLFLEIPTSFQTFAMPAICLVAALVCRWPEESGAVAPLAVRRLASAAAVDAGPGSGSV